MTHLGVADEEQINNMSYVLFEHILERLGQKMMYDAVVNYAGNSFCEKSWELIMENYPMTKHDGEKAQAGGGALKGLSGIAKLAQRGHVKVMSKGQGLPGSLGKLAQKAKGKK